LLRPDDVFTLGQMLGACCGYLAGLDPPSVFDMIVEREFRLAEALRELGLDAEMFTSPK
jgi:hypothetical protein